MKKKELELENKILAELAQQLGNSLIETIKKTQKMHSLIEAQNELIGAQNKMIGELRSGLNVQEDKE